MLSTQSYETELSYRDSTLLCLTKHQAIEVYGGHEGKASDI
jgi:hypothetical protein